MKLLPLLLLTSLLLSACSIGNNNDEVIFERNKSCWTYKESLEKEWSTLYLSVKEIFYSPKMNTCIYTVGESTGTTVFKIGSSKELLSGNTLEGCKKFYGEIDDKSFYNNCAKEAANLETQIKELRGE